MINPEIGPSIVALSLEFNGPRRLFPVSVVWLLRMDDKRRRGQKKPFMLQFRVGQLNEKRKQKSSISYGGVGFGIFDCLYISRGGGFYLLRLRLFLSFFWVLNDLPAQVVDDKRIALIPCTNQSHEPESRGFMDHKLALGPPSIIFVI